MVGVVTLKKLANATNQGFPFPAEFCPEPIYQHTTAYIHYINIDLLHFQWLHRSPFCSSVVLSVVLRPAVSVLTGNLLEMQILDLYPDLQNQKLFCWGPSSLWSYKLFR